jgi:hypothetical protein
MKREGWMLKGNSLSVSPFPRISVSPFPRISVSPCPHVSVSPCPHVPVSLRPLVAASRLHYDKRRIGRRFAREKSAAL